MIRHLFTAALRNVVANRLQTAIAVIGLAIGLAAAILAGLVIRNQFTYDSFLPLHERLYVLGIDATVGAGAAAVHIPYSLSDEAEKLKQKIPEIEAIARTSLGVGTHLRHGKVQGEETITSVDPDLFDLLRLPTLYGDLKTALAQPDAIVIPLSTARKYFGADNVVGETLVVNKQHPLRISAVLADLPVNGSNLKNAIFVSGKAPWSALAEADRAPRPLQDVDSMTFVRLAPGASVKDVQARMTGMGRLLLPMPPSIHAQPRLVAIEALNVDPDFSPGVRDRLAAFTVLTLAILALSVINFVNLVTARAAKRAAEIGVRQACGAGRRDLAIQFLGEAVMQAMFALLLALATVEWASPLVNMTLQTGASLGQGSPILLAAALVGGTILVGLLAGFYPAMVMTAFRPVRVFKGGLLGNGRDGVRQALVILQFAVLVALGIGAGVLLLQYRFALSRTFQHADRTLFVAVSHCDGQFRDRLADVAGVEATACTDISFVKGIGGRLTVKYPDGGTLALESVTAGPGLVGMFGQGPIAGRDMTAADRLNEMGLGLKASDPPIHVMINRTAVRKLGFHTPDAAIGHILHMQEIAVPMVIVGVVRDFSAYALEKPIGPTVYYYRADVPSLNPLMAVKLSGDPQTVKAIVGQRWDQTAQENPFDSMFLSEWIAIQRQPLLAEGAAVGVFAGIAMLLGCLGLFGLSVSAAERRTKEIGVRKSMGAGRRDVLALLLWQFARPVLWANAIAWPVAFWAANRWLNGFAYHIVLPLWLFPLVGLATLIIALLTVSGQALFVALQKPILALRYE